MSEGLFRKEAVEFATQRLYGHVIVLPKVSHVLALVFFSLCTVLFVSALLVGKRVEQVTVYGELRYRGDNGANAELFLPESLAHHLRAGDKLLLSASGFDSESVRRIPAVVERVSDRRALHHPSATAPGRVYFPAMLSINSAALRDAGLPPSVDAPLNVETRIVVREESWFRWLIGTLGSGDRVA